jgi:hypothetical protein
MSKVFSGDDRPFIRLRFVRCRADHSFVLACGRTSTPEFIWGRGVELLIDAVTLTLNNQTKIYATLLADVGVRYPGAFAVTAPVNATATSEHDADRRHDKRSA